MKHTKAPWIVSEVRTANEFGVQGIDISSHNYRDFATIWNTKGMESENEANAKLIAAAPEMLNTLFEIEEYINKMGHVSIAMQNIKNKTKEIIKKATI